MLGSIGEKTLDAAQADLQKDLPQITEAEQYVIGTAIKSLQAMIEALLTGYTIEVRVVKKMA